MSGGPTTFGFDYSVDIRHSVRVSSSMVPRAVAAWLVEEGHYLVFFNSSASASLPAEP